MKRQSDERPAKPTATYLPVPLPPRAPAAFHLLAKPAGAACNLACTYCFYLPKEALYPGSSLRMPDELLELYIKQLLESHRAPRVAIAWQGGEPTLMGVGFYRQAIAYQERYRKPGMTFENTLQTNGTLLDDEWCTFFKENHFLIGLSLDGPRRLHDVHRVDRAGQPTFDRVMRGLRLLQKHEVMPFAGIFFLWFVGVIRDRLGESEDRFFATVTLGSALIFVALTFAACAVAGGLFDSYRVGGSQAMPSRCTCSAVPSSTRPLTPTRSRWPASLCSRWAHSSNARA